MKKIIFFGALTTVGYVGLCFGMLFFGQKYCVQNIGSFIERNFCVFVDYSTDNYTIEVIGVEKVVVEDYLIEGTQLTARYRKVTETPFETQPMEVLVVFSQPNGEVSLFTEYFLYPSIYSSQGWFYEPDLRDAYLFPGHIWENPKGVEILSNCAQMDVDMRQGFLACLDEKLEAPLVEVVE